MTKQITALLAIAVLMISGCAPRAGADASVSDGELHVSFPSILVEYDQSGEASVLNMPVSELKETLGADLSALSFEAETIADLTGGGISAIHIDNQPGGLRFFIDGQSYPSLVWDDDARAGLVTTLDQMGTDAGPVAGILGLLPDLGMGLTMAMPGASSNDLRVSGSTLLDQDVADAALAKARAATPMITIDLKYDEDGVPSGQLPPTFGMIGVTHETLTFDAETMASMADQGIEEIVVMTTGSGLIFSVNGNDLPYVAWTNDELSRMVNLLPIFTEPGQVPAEALPLIPSILGAVLKLQLQFPS